MAHPDNTRSTSWRLDWIPRPDRTSQRFLDKIAKARLTRNDLEDIKVLYELLDEERTAARLPPAQRWPTPWTKIDILEWKEMNDLEKYLDIKGAARLSDRDHGIANVPLAA